MPTVRELAAEFGVSPGLVKTSLLRLAVFTEGPHTNVSDHNAKRFREEFGPKILAARPKPEVAAIMADVTDTGKARDRRLRVPDDHVIRMAHAHIDARRVRPNPDSMLQSSDRIPVLSKTPGLVHAIDPVGTRDGDPWSGRRVTAEHSIYSHPGPPAACGARVRAVLSDEFALDTPNACPRCREAFESGKARRNPPRWDRFDRFDCGAVVEVEIEGVRQIESCCLRDFHGGRHRSHTGASWRAGPSDFTAAREGGPGNSATG